MNKEIINQIYITLLLAQKANSDRQRHHKDLGSLITELCQAGNHSASAPEDNPFETAKKNYTSRLYSKAEAYRVSMEAIINKKIALGNYLKSEEDFIEIANYYRFAYYGIFYICRAIFINLENADYSEHKELGGKLKKIIDEQKIRIDNLEEQVKKAPNDDAKNELENKIKKERSDLSKKQTIDLNRKVLKAWREIGDYSLIEINRKDLIDLNNFDQAYEHLKSALTDWGNLK